MRINPPTLFRILIAAIVAVDRFFPLIEFAETWLPWCGAAFAISGVGAKAIIQTDQHMSVFSLPANYSEKNSTFSKKAFAPRMSLWYSSESRIG